MYQQEKEITTIKLEAMKYFLRYTQNSNADVERNESYHASGVSEDESTAEDMAAAFGCDEDEISLLDNGLWSNGENNGDMCYFQILDGLCGFELEADNLEDAIEEAKDHSFNSVYNFESMSDIATIFEGRLSGDCEEGILFYAEKIAYKF